MINGRYNQEIEYFTEKIKGPSRYLGSHFFVYSAKLKEKNRYNLQQKSKTSPYFKPIKIAEKKITPKREINELIEAEIKYSSERLSLLRERGAIDISNSIWNYTIDFLEEMYTNFLKRYRKQIEIPKIDFIEDSIEIRWEKDKTKLILSITEYIEDIIVYVKKENGQIFSDTVPREKVDELIFFWLNLI